MRNRAHTIDVGKALPAVKTELRHHGNLQRLVAGTHAGRNNKDVVASAHTAIATLEPHEGRALGFRDVSSCRSAKIRGYIAHYRHFITHIGVIDNVSRCDSR